MLAALGYHLLSSMPQDCPTMAPRRSTNARIYDLRLELEGIAPLIWRRLHVAATISLPRLHNVLQVAMGWTDSHLHSFRIGDREYSNAEELDELNMLDVKGRKLEALLGGTIREFDYQYDFGDSWQHRIVVESITTPKVDWPYPLCVAGARACPPEDVGGIGRYQNFLEAIANPDHEEHESMLAWVGGAFDPEGFDINSVNRELRRLRL
jgi:hypothetical protein